MIGVPSDDNAMFTSKQGGEISLGHRGFMKRVVAKANKSDAPPQNASASTAIDLLKAFGMKSDEPQQVVVNMHEQLKKISLAQLPLSCLPDAQLTNALATKRSSWVKKGIAAPFLFVDLDKWLPNWCSMHGASALERFEQQEQEEKASSQAVHEIRSALGIQSKPRLRLTMTQWASSFDRMALAFQFTDQWDLHASMAHKDVCMAIAEKSHIGNRRQWLAIEYDRLARREWSQASFSQMPGFDVNVESLTVSKTLLMQAEAEYDRLNAQNAKPPPPPQHHFSDLKGKGKRKGKHGKGEFQDLKREREAGPDGAPAAKRLPY